MKKACEDNRDKLSNIGYKACKAQATFYRFVLWDKGAGNNAFDTVQQSAAKEIGATYTKPKRRAPQPWEVIKDARSNKAYPAKQYMPKFLKN